MTKETKETTQEELVQIPVKEYKGILERLNALEKGNRVTKPKRINEHVAKVAIIDKQPVIGWDQVKDENINLKLLNGKQKTVNFLEWMNRGERVEAMILKQTTEMIEEEIGTTRQTNFNSSKLLTEVGQEVDMVVKSFKNRSKVKVLSGELKDLEFEVDNEYLNP